MWKVGLVNTPFFDHELNARTSDALNYTMHHSTSNKWLKWTKSEAWLCRYVNKHPDKEDEIKEIYYRIFKSRYPHIKAMIWGQVYRIKNILSNMQK